MKFKTKVSVAFFTIVAGALVYFVYPYVHLYLVGKRNHMFEGVTREDYAPTTKGNLLALHTALSLYAESEGQFPSAGGWMDAIENRLQTNNLHAGEGEKKLHSPRFSESKGFGYAINDACANKYPGDIKPADKTILIFDIDKSEKNSHGDPAKDGLHGGFGVTVSGDVVPL